MGLSNIMLVSRNGAVTVALSQEPVIFMTIARIPALLALRSAVTAIQFAQWRPVLQRVLRELPETA